MKKIVANILDWPKPSLEPAIWSEDNTLKPEVKKFILDFISSFAQANNFKATDQWITELKFVGSLTTNCWNSNSDMDIHIGVDLPKFVEVERPEMSDKEASNYLDEIRKQVDQVKAKVPGTEHPTEIYFETEFTTHASQAFSGTYSVLEDKWLVEPHIVGQDFDISTLHPDLLNLAKETASELDAAFGEIKRDVADIKELNETINDCPAEQRSLFEKKLQKRLEDLESEIKELVVIREDVAEKRKHYDAVSEQEVRFKYLQKYFYMHVLTDLKTLLKQSPELSVKDIPVVENIMQQANLKLAYHEDENRILVDMDDTICHETSDNECGEPMEGVKEALTKLKEQGFEIVIFSHRADEKHGEDEIKKYLEVHEIPYDSIFQGEKPLAKFYVDDRAIHFDNWNSVLKQIEKSASLPNGYWIDPSGKRYPVTGLSGGMSHVDFIYKHFGVGRKDFDKKEKEMFKEGWSRISHDYTSEQQFFIQVGNLRNLPPYLDGFIAEFYKPNDPVKGILMEDGKEYITVNDPFPSLQEAVNEELKRPKIESSIDLPIIDPKTFQRKEPYALFIGTGDYGSAGKIDMFNVYGKHPMITESNAVPTVTLDTLVKENIPVIGKEPRAGDKQPVQDISGLVKQAQLGSKYDYSSTHFLLPTNIAEKIIRWGVENIPEEEIVHDPDGTKGIQVESHVTLKYGLLTDDFEDLKRVLDGEKAPHIKFGKTSFFEPEGKDYDVVVIEVESEDLQDLSKKLCSQVKCNDEHDGYNPHVTVAYVKKGLGKKYEGKDIITGEEIYLDTLTFSPKEGEPRQLELKNKVKKNASDYVHRAYNPQNPTAPDIFIYKNPSLEKFKQLYIESGMGLRYFITNSGDMWVWDSLELIHQDVAEQLGYDYNTAFEDLGQVEDDKTFNKFIKFYFSKPQKESSFMPSNTDLAPSNDWSGDVGWPGNEEMDPVWPRGDGENYYSPMDDRPREKSVWWKLLNMFKKQQPMSKKDVVPVKEASSNVFMLETDSGLQTKALRDPTPEQAGNLFNSTRGEVHQLRWFIPIDGHLYMWDAYDLTHWDAIKQIGIPATKLAEDINTGVARTDQEAEIIAEEFKEFGFVNMNKQAKQWTTPKEPVNQPGMSWQWADYIYDYIAEMWRDLLHDWLGLDPDNYVKPVILIQEIYEDEGVVSAWVHLEFINKAGTSDAFMKFVISAKIEGEENVEPEGREYYEHLTDWEMEVVDYGKSDELEKSSSYGPTNYKGPSVADELYQDSPYRMNVTYSPEEDEELMDQNGKGGYPNRWMSRHRGPYYTNEGKVVKMLEETSALETLPEQQPMPEQANTAVMTDDGSIYYSNDPYMIHVKLIREFGIPVERIISGGHIVDGVYYDTGSRSDTMRYVERELAKKRVEQKHKALGRKDIKADISGQVINNILKLIQQTGGATYNLSKGNLVGTNAFAVAIYPDREQIVEGIDFDTLEGYVAQNEDLLSNSNNSFGAWVSNGKVYLDVVATVPTKEQAMELGYRHKQLAIFDLKNLVEIPLQRVAKLAAAVSDKEQQAYYDKIFSDRWRDSSDPIDGGNEYNKGWSELNGNDFPGPKDLDKERALLDQLEKPVNRNNPVGLGEYAITYYDAFPDQGDQGGI